MRSTEASHSATPAQTRGGPPGTRPTRKVSEPRNSAPGTSASRKPSAATTPWAMAPPTVP